MNVAPMGNAYLGRKNTTWLLSQDNVLSIKARLGPHILEYKFEIYSVGNRIH